jgi:hypothetical protein
VKGGYRPLAQGKTIPPKVVKPEGFFPQCFLEKNFQKVLNCYIRANILKIFLALALGIGEGLLQMRTASI